MDYCKWSDSDHVCLPDNYRFKAEFLPRAAEVLPPVHYCYPVLRVQRHLDIVGIGSGEREGGGGGRRGGGGGGGGGGERKEGGGGVGWGGGG